MSRAPFHSVVYGPLKTSFYAKSLGVNLMPKATDDCEEDCIFCTTGLQEAVPVLSGNNKAPSAGVIVTSAARRIIELSKGGEKLQSLVVTGDEDPASHPGFAEVTENLRALRDKWFSKAKLCIECPSYDLASPELRRLLSIYDRPILRFEWGLAKTFASATGEPSTKLKVYQAELAAMDRLVLQANFGKGTVDNSTDNEVRNWIKRLDEIRPGEVLVTTGEPARNARGKRPRRVTPARLEKIAGMVTEETGIPATVLEREVQPA